MTNAKAGEACIIMLGDPEEALDMIAIEVYSDPNVPEETKTKLLIEALKRKGL